MFDCRSLLLPNSNVSVRNVKYNTGKKTFSLLVFLLWKIKNLILNDSFCTRREIYYQIVKYVKCQRQVDDAMNRISFMLNAAPWDLRVVGTSKGLIYGDMRIVFCSQEIVCCNATGGKLMYVWKLISGCRILFASVIFKYHRYS